LSKFRPPPSGFIVMAIGVVTTLLMTVCLGLAGYLWSEGVFESEKEQIEKLTAAIIPDNSVVFDRKGVKIGEYFNYYHIQIPYDKIPKPMINCLLAVEDRQFFQHEGVNWTSIARAFLSVVTSGRLKQGGSTITMQLVKNYLLTREKKVSRKLREIILAYYVEKNLSKERILELYLNTMYMGHGAYGVGAASRVYFGKSLDELNLAEYALLAGLFQAPSAYDPHKSPAAALKRQKVVLAAPKTILNLQSTSNCYLNLGLLLTKLWHRFSFRGLELKLKKS
jgi:penicillin-binding protein 1A